MPSTYLKRIFILILGFVFSLFSGFSLAREIKYFGVNYRDPFLSFLPEEKVEKIIEKVVPPPLKLQGIIWGTDRPQVIINGTVLDKGDVIGGAKIIEIKKEGIDFIYKDRCFWIDRISGTVKEKTEK